MLPAQKTNMALRSPSRLFLCTLLACLPIAVHAAPPQPADPAVLEIDRTLQVLKSEVFDINQQAIRTEDAFLYPEQTRVTIYVGVDAPGLLLDEVVITVDGNEPIRRKLEVTEAVALQRRGLYRALRLNVTPGAHRMWAEFTGRYADTGADGQRMRGRYEAVFDKTDRASDLEILISTPGLGMQPTMALRDWRPSR